MPTASAKENVARTAHLTAWMRTLARATSGSGADAANADYLAERCLLPMQRRSLVAPRLSRWFVERAMPGGLGYFNARTRYFDEMLTRELALGLDQLVLLGAGFDSRPFRFASELASARVFAVDMPRVLSVREALLGQVPQARSSVAVPIDFERDDLSERLLAHGYEIEGARTLFLWEGVTYYLPPEAVDAVLGKIAALSSARSSLIFDYSTQAFFAGDNSSYGAKRLADGWRRLGNVHRSGVSDVSALLQPHGFSLQSDIGARELESRYLNALPGGALKAWGALRIAHAQRSNPLESTRDQQHGT
jgi:methyltransferase (TIGR00027 family)